MRLAWAEYPSLAIQLAVRFPSAKIQSDVRWLILNFPEKVIKEASALEIMFDSSLPSDVNFQLKVSTTMLYPGLCQANCGSVSVILGPGESD